MATLLTGATGMVGSQLLLNLLQEGEHVVCIVRDTPGNEDAEQRIDAGMHHHQLHVLPGDTAEVRCGLTDDQVREWRGRISRIVHAAALTKFDSALADDVIRVNLKGTKNVLDLADALGVSDFHYMSTAYVAGGADNFTESDIGTEDQARNPYELSKQRAEALVRTRCPGSHSIYRLAIVTGDSMSGFTPGYDGFYGYFSPFWHVRDRLRAFDGDLCFYIRIQPDVTMNLVPIDWVTDTLDKLLKYRPEGKTYHLTHPKPPTLGWMCDVAFRTLRLPVSFVHLNAKRELHNDEEAKRLQRLIDRMLGRFRPYASHEAVFDMTELRETLGYDYVPPPPIDEELIAEKYLPYAMETNFGRSREEVLAA